MALRLSGVETIKCPNGRTLAGWLQGFKFFAAKRVHVVKNSDDELYIKIYTARNCYAIRAIGECIQELKESNDIHTYLGCVGSSRTPRPGEDWTRGNDLPDGYFNEKTFHHILGAIVFYEALEVAKDIKPITCDEEGVECEDTGVAA